MDAKLKDGYASRLDSVWRSSWRPRDKAEVWKWCENNITAIPYSPLKGAFRASTSPWLKDPLGEIAEDKTDLIVVQAAIQSGKTLFLELATSWINCNDPSPMMLTLQNDSEAQDEHVNRLWPLWENCSSMEGLLPPRHKRKKDSVTFNTGATFYCCSYSNKNNLQRRSLKRVIADECWMMPEGHLRELEARTSAFSWQAQRILTGQAGIPDDQFDQRFNETNMAEWHVVCPRCGSAQPYAWEQFTWEDHKLEDGSPNFPAIRESVRFNCNCCGHAFEDTHANRNVLSNDARRHIQPFTYSECEVTGEKVYGLLDPSKGARFISKNPDAVESKRGYTWNSFVMVSWADIVEEFIRAKHALKRGDETLMTIFYQKRLAQHYDNYKDDSILEIEASGYDPKDSWEREGAIHRTNKIMLREELEEIQDRKQSRENESAEKESRPPRQIQEMRAPLRTMGVDVQMDHQFLAVRSWSPDGDSRLLHWQRTGSFEEIERVRQEWGVTPRLVMVDSGFNAKGNAKVGKDKVGVYARCARYGWTATMGEGIKENWHHGVSVRENGRSVRKKVERFYSPVNKVSVDGNRTCRRINFSTLHLKDMFNIIRQNQDPDQGPTWEVYHDVDEYYLRSMDSEIRTLEKNKWIWLPRHSSAPNHLLDCEVLNTLAALMLRLIGRETLDEENNPVG